MKAFVYYNLHKHRLSVKALSGSQKGRVVAHAVRVVLHDCEFRVSEAGRQRVIREKRKNVHAGVVGTLKLMEGHKTNAGRDSDQYIPDAYPIEYWPAVMDYKIGYNPYITRAFHILRQEGVEGHDHWHLTDLRDRYVSKADSVLISAVNRTIWSTKPELL